MTRSAGQIAYEARWFFKRNLRRWADERTETQRRYEEAAQAVLTMPCEHEHATLFQLHAPNDPKVHRIFSCHECGALRLDHGALQGPWILPRRMRPGGTGTYVDPPPKPVGRPPLPPEEQLTTLLSVRTSAAERVALERAAALAGLGLSAWARAILLGATGGAP